MTRRRPAAALALAASVLAASGLAEPAWAGCSTAATGARCVSAPARPPAVALAGEAMMSNASAASPAVQPGEVLPRGRYSILLNADYYGLPPVSDGWVYMRVGRDLYRVDWQSHQVLERVTDRAAANFF